MNFNRDKFKRLVQYICNRTEPSKLGATKLNKILWLSDFRAYYETGHPITGDRYIRRQHGPVPSAIMPVMRELESENLLIVRTVQFHGKEKREYIAPFSPKMDDFTNEELRVVNDCITFIAEEHTATSISKFSHDRVWEVAETGEEIPYYTIFCVPAPITDHEREWARTVLAG